MSTARLVITAVVSKAQQKGSGIRRFPSMATPAVHPLPRQRRRDIGAALAPTAGDCGARPEVPKSASCRMSQNPRGSRLPRTRSNRRRPVAHGRATAKVPGVSTIWRIL